MGFIDTGYFGSSFHDFLLLDSINAYNFNPISWLNNIDIVIECNNSNCMWRLSFWNILRELLEFYKLLICEFTEIVDDLIAVIGFAIFTGFWFLDFGILKGDSTD